MEPLTDAEIRGLTQKANAIRQTIIEMLVAAGSGHTAGPLGMADIFTALYFSVLKHDPKKPNWPDRDRLILSNGHIVPVRYAAMAHAGYFPIEECLTLRKFGSRLQGHPERERLPGLGRSSDDHLMLRHRLQRQRRPSEDQMRLPVLLRPELLREVELPCP